MITRDVSQLMVVPGIASFARFHSCTVAGFTCFEAGQTSALGSSQFYPGFIIDRLGLPLQFNAVAVAPLLFGSFGSTGAGAGDILAATISAGILHASASGGTFAAYSTDRWLADRELWRQTTATSTANTAYSVVQGDVGLTSEIGIGGIVSTATSTASGQGMVAGTSSTGPFWYTGAPAVFDLTGAKRFIKCAVRANIQTTGCGAVDAVLGANLIFGEPAQVTCYQPTKRILVTTGCAT